MPPKFKWLLSSRPAGTKADVFPSAKYANPLETISRTSSRMYDSKPNGGYMTGQAAPLIASLGSTFNVVLFGEVGVGKSAVINLIARKDIAVVSPDANPCTMQYKRYDVPLDGMDLAIYDTAGLEEPQIGVDGYLTTIERAYELINKLGASGGIHLLLFCMRGGRITATTQSNYRLFRECLCNTRVPIALIFTCLEREVEMEDWWRRNKKDIEGYGIKSDGHACVTAVQDNEDNHKYLESQTRIRQLLKECAIKHNPFSLETHPWFARFMKGMKGFIKGKTSPKEKDLMKVLTRRCKLDQETARKVVAMIENGDVETNGGEDSRERSGGSGPRKETVPEKNQTTLRSSPSERADLQAGTLNNESVPNRRDEDSRGMNGDDEPEDGREAVPGEPLTKDNPPPKEHEDPEAGDGEGPAKKSTDESMSNEHDRKGQQAGIKGRGQTGTGKIPTNGDSSLDKHDREEDRLPRKRRGSGRRTTEAATQSTRGDSLFDEYERKGVQQAVPGRGYGRKETEAAMVSTLSPPKTHYRNEHLPAGKDESGGRDGWEIRVAKDLTMDRSSSDKNEKLRATKVQSGEKRALKGILTNDNPPQTRKDLSSDGEGSWQFAEKESAGDQSPAVEQKVPGAFRF